MRRARGFTLVEVMLVVVIIGILVAVTAPRLAGRTESARQAAASTDVQLNIATALKMYAFDNGALPTTEEGLAALVAAPSGARNWKGPYLEKEPSDPWGRDYVYRSPGSHRSDYDLYSLGKDGMESSDDVVNWDVK